MRINLIPFSDKQMNKPERLNRHGDMITQDVVDRVVNR